MPHLRLVLEIPQRRVDRTFGQRGEAHRGNEMRAALGQHGRDRMAFLAQQADELGRLVGGDAPADDEKDAAHETGYGLRRYGFRKVGEGFGQECQPDEGQRSGDQRPVESVGAGEEREHRAVAEQQEEGAQGPARTHRSPAEQRKDEERCRQCVGQANSHRDLGNALQGELQAEQARPPLGGGVAGKDHLRHPIGVERHIEGEDRDDERPARRFAPTLLDKRQPAHREDHRQGQFPNHQRRAACDHCRPGPARPPDRNHQRQQQRRPAFVKQAGHRLKQPAQARPPSGTWMRQASVAGEEVSAGTTRQPSARRTVSQTMTTITRSPRAA